ncbi:MAG TPA: hypothetical protein VKR58_07345 [Aquella sp.]|nr:hypothetical protein [Aquella sp.]
MKKFLLVLLASTSIAYAAKITCPLSPADIKEKIRSSPNHSVTLNYSADQKATANKCKTSIMSEAKRTHKMVTVIVPESPNMSGKGKLEVAITK